MDNPFLVIKQHLNGYTHKLFATAEQAQHAVNPSAEFPGEYISVYNLQTKRYLHMEQFPGIDSNVLEQIINQYLKV